MRDFVARGGGWVAAQAALLTALVVLATIRPVPFSFVGHQAVGWAMVVAGAITTLTAAAALGSSLSPFPTPVSSGRFVAKGPYGIVRHPIYTGVITGSVGFSVAQGDWPSLAVAIALLPFFYAKAIREEAHLLASYRDYESYRAQVTRRIVPGVL